MLFFNKIYNEELLKKHLKNDFENFKQVLLGFIVRLNYSELYNTELVLNYNTSKTPITYSILILRKDKDGQVINERVLDFTKSGKLISDETYDYNF
ncbi:MAG: hypothetical protein C0173_10115 [Desulfurella sp.]|uniref:hypothetical protein n=1 Tax=Desulfurella sp. TaxID=1962857 RepID=UPI000CB50602|nr:hypothetical protein [Desulfurella sp.]PMP87093.1 MAG: hypothetical protein C0173_10115 [Desulfurella sp.]